MGGTAEKGRDPYHHCQHPSAAVPHCARHVAVQPLLVACPTFKLLQEPLLALLSSALS